MKSRIGVFLCQYARKRKKTKEFVDALCIRFNLHLLFLFILFPLIRN